MTMTKIDIEKRMQMKLKAIPTIKISEKERESFIIKNRKEDHENLERTKKILEERRKEAVDEGNHKKKFYSIVMEKDEKALYVDRENLHQIQIQINMIRKGFEDDVWKTLEIFSDLKNKAFWDKAKKVGKYNINKISQYYRDFIGLSPKKVTDFLKYMKLNEELKKYKKK